MRKLISLLFAVTCVAPCWAQVNTAISPVPKFQFISSNGLPLAGGCLFSFATGTSSPLGTYTDATGLTLNPNPVILDSSGSANVWLGPQKYRLQLFSAGGSNCSSGSQLWQVDGVSGNNIQTNTAISATAQLAPTCTANQYILWADSTIQRWRFCNNGTLDTIVGLNTTDTLANKTLTNPVLTNGSWSNPSLSGATFTGSTFNSNTLNTSTLNNSVFSGTSTGQLFLGNPGFFGNVSTENLLGMLNGCGPSGEFGLSHASEPVQDTVAGCVAVPSTATIFQQNAVAGYAHTAAPQIGGGGAVGGYFQGRVDAGNSNADIWGSNSLVQDVAGVTGTQMISIESDTNVIGTPARVWGLMINGFVTGTLPTGIDNASAINVQSKWLGGLDLRTGCCSTAAINIEPQLTGSSQPSQALFFNATSPGGSNEQISVAENLNGWLLVPCSATNMSVFSGFNGGTVNTGNTGFCTFQVTIGSGTAVSTGVIALPADSAGWVCMATNQNRADLIQQTAQTSTSVTLTNFGDASPHVATNWTNGDLIEVICQPR